MSLRVLKILVLASLLSVIPSMVNAQTQNVSGSLNPSQITGLAPSATTDTTNASNITSGTLDNGRLPTSMIRPPYYYVGGLSYVMDTAYKATYPSFSIGWSSLAGAVKGTNWTETAGVNGNLLEVNSSNSHVWLATSATTSIEAEYSCTGLTGTNMDCILFLMDSTDKILACDDYSAGSGENNFVTATWTWNGTSTVSYTTGGNYYDQPSPGGTIHEKVYYSGGTAYCAFSTDGGNTFSTIGSLAMGTPVKAGWTMAGAAMNFYSVVVQ